MPNILAELSTEEYTLLFGVIVEALILAVLGYRAAAATLARFAWPADGAAAKALVRGNPVPKN